MLPGINRPFGHLAAATGASVDELKLILSFLLSYPLAGILKRIPDKKPWLKNVFIIGVSLFYLVGLFDLWTGLRTIVISSVGAYAIANYIDGSLMPWIAFVFLMGHMSISHLHRQFANNARSVDITGAQMVLVMKLTAFCWNVHDGRLKPEVLTEGQKEKAIRKLPGFLDYTAYVLFFPSLFAGPAFDFVDYRHWIETTMFDTPPNATAPPTRKQRRIPRSGRPATFKAVGGLLWIALYLQIGERYGPHVVLAPNYIDYPFWHRVWLLYMLGFISRLRYYGVWSLTEGACILTGMGYNGIDPITKTPKWDRLNNVVPWSIESAQNSRGYLEGWNKNTNNWLRNYVYLRVTPKGKKPGFRATLATFTTSAFWHGFYPGYYLTFILGAFIQTVAKNFRRFVRPFFLTPDGKKPLPSKRYYDVACWVITQAAFSFTTAPFVILNFGDSIKVWGRVYFYTIIGVVVSIAFFASPARGTLIHKLKKRGGGSVAGASDGTKPARPGSNSPMMQRKYSTEHIREPILGMSDDPAREIDEAIDEIKLEVEARRRRGSKIEMPSGESLKKAIDEKIRFKFGNDSSGEKTDGSEKGDLNISQGLVNNAISKESRKSK